MKREHFGDPEPAQANPIDQFYTKNTEVKRCAEPNPEFVDEFSKQAAMANSSTSCDESGRGIVICGGGWAMLAGVYVTVSLLRWERINSRLPIEVWYNGDNGELDPVFPLLTKHLNVTWRDASEEMRKRGIVRKEKLKGWAIKPLALSLCSFAEVCMVDADCYPVSDPERLMDDHYIKAKGAAFWPDNQAHPAGKSLTEDQWALFGMDMPTSAIPGFESGQIIVDKRRHRAAVKLLAWLSDRFDEFDVTRGKAEGLHGDKDTFSVAFRATNSDYWMAPPFRHQEVAILQHDRRGQIAFVHRCQDKLRLTRGWHHTPQRFEHTNFRSTTLPHEHMVHHYLQELRDRLRPDIPAFRDGTQDEQIWREAHIQNAYRLPEIMDGWRVLDIGAHIGLVTLECLNRGAEHVTCVEPFGPNCDFLRRNLMAWEKKTTIICAAVAAPGVAEVGIRATLNHPHYTGEAHVSPDGVPVPAISLDELLEKTGPVDLLKLDCEGGEYPGLLNATQLDLVDRIALEWHSHGCAHTPEELAAKLEAYGFTVEWEGNGIGMMFATSTRNDRRLVRGASSKSSATSKL